MTRPRLAYVMSRFPHLTETFILREVVALEAARWQVFLYPLILQDQSVVHADAITWTARARALPYFSGRVFAANLRALVEQPRRYISTVLGALWGNRTSGRFLLRTAVLLPKIVYAAELMRRDGIDHLHAHYATHPALAAWVIRRLTGIPYSVTIHGHDLFVNRTMIGSKLRDAAFVVTISNYNKQFLHDQVSPAVAAKTQVVRCGVPDPGRRAAAGVRLPGSRFEIMSIGSLERHKGFHILCDALVMLVTRGIDCRCRIVGEGSERGTLSEQIERTGLTGRVELLGARTATEVETLLASAHCYVQPSLWAPSGKGEGLPVALMEALAAGLPVVASSLAGIPELVRDRETGWLVPPENADALATALENIEHHPEETLAVAARGRDLVCRDYDLDLNVSQLARLFETSSQGRAE